VTPETPSTPVLAAGALCWRIVDGKVRILLVHRGDRADVSLPKGKVDPGETLPQTAVREIAEETGLGIHLGAPLGTVEYQLPNGRDKVVYYWSAEIDDETLNRTTFAPNAEIASLEWVSMKKARAKLSYPHDLDVLDRFDALLEAGHARTFAVIALRHGKAIAPEMWDGPDATRPLMHRGVDQAASVAAGLAAYAPKRLISSTATRCLSTIQPAAELLGLEVTSTASISQDAYERGASKVTEVVAKRLRKKKSVVLCSHGPVIPQIIDEVARLTGTAQLPALRSAAMLGTGEFTVLHVSAGDLTSGIVAIETHGPSSV
jgi:8-oxo-(d)GTP phosphatase